MDSEQEVIHKQMEETRSDLTNKLSALEAQVNTTVQATTDVVQSTTEAVTGTVESVQETVENVTEKLQETVADVTDSVQQAVEGVKESVEETVKSVAETCNLNLQCERHPWMVFCGAVTVGCVGSMLLSGSRRKATPSSKSELLPQARYDAGEEPKTNGARSQAQPEQSSAADQSGATGWLWEKLKGLRSLAVGAMMSAARDFVTQTLPEKLKERVSEEVNNLTKSLGGEPIEGAVLAEDQSRASEPSQEKEPGQQPAQFGGKERSEKTAGRAARPALTKNGR